MPPPSSARVNAMYPVLMMKLSSALILPLYIASGVVQLFNAVRKQQTEVQSQLKEAGGSLRKTERALQAVSKQSFMERLREGADDEVTPPRQVRPKC